MKADYSQMTSEDEYRILQDLVRKTPAGALLEIGDIATILKEEFNNEILEQWEKENPALAFDHAGIRKEINQLGRDEVVKLLEGACIACYDHEEDEVLREALFQNVIDDTIPRWSLTEGGAQ